MVRASVPTLSAAVLMLMLMLMLMLVIVVVVVVVVVVVILIANRYHFKERADRDRRQIVGPQSDPQKSVCSAHPAIQ
jgi:heme/copper-type cytochrome/quinol oxidase subunit 2